MIMKLTCKYCGYKWEKLAYKYALKDTLKAVKCPKCNDSNFSAEEITNTKIDYYKGCPEFKTDQQYVEEDYSNMPYFNPNKDGICRKCRIFLSEEETFMPKKKFNTKEAARSRGKRGDVIEYVYTKESLDFWAASHNWRKRKQNG